MLLAYFSGHRAACTSKQRERAARIASLPAIYRDPLSAHDETILATPLEKLVAEVHTGEVKPLDVLHAYGKKALKVHEQTDCLTEILILDAEKWAREADDTKGPLAGIPGIPLFDLLT
jgi:hypothetical protein